MKRAALIATVAALVAAMAVPAYAAGGPIADAGGNGPGVGVMDQDRDQARDQDCAVDGVATGDCTADQDRDRIQAQDRDQDCIVDGVATGDCTADQDRDRIQAQDRDQIRDEDCLTGDCIADQERVQTRAQDGTGMPGDAPAAQVRAMVQQRQEQVYDAVRTALAERFRLMAQWQLSLTTGAADTPGAAAPAATLYDGTGFANMQQWWHAWMRQFFNLL